MKYRGYNVESNSTVGWTYAHESYDGPDGKFHCGIGWTVKGCIDSIDDIIADQLFCEKCDNSGVYHCSEGFKEQCEDCSDIRESLGDSVNFPENCILCDSPMRELYPGSGKENLRCRCC